jgi:hypothetical protein
MQYFDLNLEKNLPENEIIFHKKVCSTSHPPILYLVLLKMNNLWNWYKYRILLVFDQCWLTIVVTCSVLLHWLCRTVPVCQCVTMPLVMCLVMWYFHVHSTRDIHLVLLNKLPTTRMLNIIESCFWASVVCYLHVECMYTTSRSNTVNMKITVNIWNY